MLDKLGVPYEVRVVSAHRTPDLLFEYAGSARARGLEVLIAGAGGAAHLPGMAAAKTTCRCSACRCSPRALGGMDSLLSIVQMPAGVPVATFAIGAAGASNAALCAAAILGNKHPGDRRRARGVPRAPDRRGARQPRPARAHALMTVGIVGAGQLGRMLALAGYPLGLDFLCLDPAREAPAGQVAPQLHGAFTDRRLLHGCWPRCEVVTFDWENVPVTGLAAVARRGRARASARRSPRSPPARTAWPRSACSSGSASRPRAGTRSARRAELRRALRRHRPARRAEDAPPRLRRQGPGGGAQRRTTRRPPGASSAARRCCTRSGSPSTARCRSSARAAPAARPRSTRCAATCTATGILRLTRAPYGPSRWQRQAARYLTRVLEHFRYTRHPHHRVLRAARQAHRQRAGAARAQLRPLDHRGRRHQPVREPPARHPRPAARGHRALGHSAMVNLIGRLPPRGTLLKLDRACTCTSTARRRAPGARSATAPLWRGRRPRRDARARRLLRDLAVDVRIP